MCNRGEGEVRLGYCMRTSKISCNNLTNLAFAPITCGKNGTRVKRINVRWEYVCIASDTAERGLDADLTAVSQSASRRTIREQRRTYSSRIAAALRRDLFLVDFVAGWLVCKHWPISAWILSLTAVNKLVRLPWSRHGLDAVSTPSCRRSCHCSHRCSRHDLAAGRLRHNRGEPARSPWMNREGLDHQSSNFELTSKQPWVNSEAILRRSLHLSIASQNYLPFSIRKLPCVLSSDLAILLLQVRWNWTC